MAAHNNPSFELEKPEFEMQPKGLGAEVYPETHSKSQQSTSNPVMGLVSVVQTNAISFKKDNPTLLKCLLITLAVLCWCAFLIAALILNFDRAWPLALVTVLIAMGVCYYQLIKPRLEEPMEKCFESIKEQFDRFWVYAALRWAVYGVILAALIVYLIIDTADNRHRLVSAVGLVVFILIAFVCSKSPAQVNWRPVFWGIALQFLGGILILRWDVGAQVFRFLSDNVSKFLSYTDVGSQFVYGFLVTPPNICGVFPVFAFAVLSTVIFFSSVISILYYYGVLQFIIIRVAALMQMTMGTTAAESLSAAGNIFIGQTEAPLLIKPYLDKMTLSELHAIMTGGFATIAGTVFKVYVEFGACGNHILTASVMSAPAALAVSKLFYPETKTSRTKNMKDLELGKGQESNALEAAALGACNGIFLVSNIVANLIAFLALLAFFNAVLGALGALVNVPDLTFEMICSWVFYPLAYLMGAGTDHEQLKIVAELMGIKTFLNEFVAYDKMGKYDRAGLLTPRAKLIATYALCGFSNIGAVGVQLGGIGAMCPERRADLAKVVVRALVAGSIACFMTACVAGLLTNEVSTEGCAAVNQVLANCTIV